MSEEPQRWARVKQVLNLALDSSPAERPNVVSEACEGDSVLQSDVQSLLTYTDQTCELDRCLHETVRSLIWSAETSSRIGCYRVERVLGEWERCSSVFAMTMSCPLAWH
jgi:hypothetical protein